MSHAGVSPNSARAPGYIAERRPGSAWLMALLFCACVSTPAYVAPKSLPANAHITTDRSVDAPFFDSLSRAAQLPPPSPPGAAFGATATAAVAWLDVLHDTTLVSLVRAALRDNQDLRVATARVNEYRALTGSARSGLYPLVTGNVSASTNQIAIGASSPIAYKAIRATADLQWELDFWGRLRLGAAAAEADQSMRAEDERALALTLVGQISDAYLEMLEGREALDVAQRALASRQATLALARQRFAQGVISELDVRQFEADVAGAASSVAQFTRVAAQREHAISLLLGRTPVPVPTGGTLDGSVLALAAPDSVPATMLLRRPDVLSAERALAAEQARYGATRAAVLPRFVITGQYGRQSPGLSDVFGSDHEIYAAQIGLSVPLFAGGRQSSELEAGRARIEQAHGRYEQAVLRAVNETADALVALRTDRQQLAAVTAQAVALRDAYRLANRRYEGGIASYIEVLEAQRSLFTAELGVTQGRRAYLEATVELYKALGGSWQ